MGKHSPQAQMKSNNLPQKPLPYRPEQNTYSSLVSKHKTKKKNFKDYLSTILIVVGFLLMLAGGIYYGYTQWCYYGQSQTNSKLAQYATIPDAQTDNNGDETNGAPEVDWAGLKAINSEVVGWLQMPGTPVNYPVYHTTDNERYLRHNAEGKWTIGGQVFMDCDNKEPGLVDYQTVLYGHHLKDGTMFYHFFLLNDQDKFNKTKTIWYVTEKKAYELEPLFVYYTQPEDLDVRKLSFANDQEFHDYLQQRLQKAVTRRADADQIIPRLKHVMTMSTCNYYEGYGRSETVCALKSEVNLSD